MPGMSGVELIHAFVEKQSHIKGRLMSDADDPRRVWTDEQPRAWPLLQKPFERSALQPLIEALLERSCHTSEPSAEDAPS